MSIAITPDISVLTLTNANTEYSVDVPADARWISFQNRQNNDIRFAFATGKVAGSTDPYATLKSKTTFTFDRAFSDVAGWNGVAGNGTLRIYFAGTVAGDRVEVVFVRAVSP